VVTYSIKIDRQAVKALAGLPRKVQRQIARRIEDLTSEPLPAGCRPIGNAEDIYRLRAGDYRIAYKVYKKGRKILILLIGHRRSFYRSV